MEQKFLIDTNILIYYYDDLIPGNTVHVVDEIFRKSFNISIISRIEFLGWKDFCFIIPKATKLLRNNFVA